MYAIGKRGGGELPSSPAVPNAVRLPLGKDEISRRIAILNEDITGAIADLGIGADSLADRQETARREGGIGYTEIGERYTIPEGLRAEKIREYLSGYVGGYPGVLREESGEVIESGFEMTVYAYGVPIRSLTFVSTKPPTPVPPHRVLPRVAIIIDDMGPNKNFVTDLLALKYPVTFSVFPHYSYTAEVAKRAHGKGREVMLHLPMEPIDYPKYNPGPGGLFVFMGDEEFVNTLAGDLDGVPYISGVNNHMGSLLTQDREKMKIVLLKIKERQLFFVDSRTTSKSIAYDLARNLGVAALERDVFLDNESDVEKIKMRIDELIKKAKKNGKALAICHPRPETIQALKEMEKRLAGSEVEVVRVKDLLNK